MHQGMDRRKRLAGALCVLSLLMAGCVRGGPGTAATASDLDASLIDQINQANGLNQTTASNALFQARTAYGNVAGRLNSLGRLDVAAFTAVRTTVQPPMLIVANALSADPGTSSETSGMVVDFRQLYSDALAQMLGGINNNLQVYQSVFETGQAFVGPVTVNDATPDAAMASLGRLFQATDVALGFAAELGQFPRVVSAAETQKVLDGIRQQQTTVINGVINFSTRGASPSALKQAYTTIVSAITSPSLMPQLLRLATAAYGTDNVAYKQDQVTPAQPSPSQIVMVVKETATQYRFISIDGAKVSNRVSSDSRGLSAADLLNQSTAVVVRP